MPSIELKHRTSLSVLEIKEKAEELIRSALKKFENKASEIQQEWVGNSLIFSFEIKDFLAWGHVNVFDGLIIVEMKIKSKHPLFAGMLKNKIKKGISEELKKSFL